MRFTSRKLLATGATALALVVGGGTALAFGPLGDQEAYLGDVATRLGVEQAELEDAIRGARVAQVDQAEADGELTEEQANTLRERIESAETPLLGGPGFRGGHGHRGDGGPGPRGPGALIEPAAESLGLSADELREQLPGRSLAEIAPGQGVDPQAVADAIVAAQEERLGDAVESGRITEERAAELQERLAERADGIVDRVFPEEGAFGRFGHRLPPPAADDRATGEAPADNATQL